MSSPDHAGAGVGDPGPTVDREASGGGGTPVAGWGIIRASAIGTGALLLATLAASVAESRATDLVNLVVSAALFLGGSGAFIAGFLVAVGRSREEEVDLAGLFYLTGTAPRRPRALLLGLWFAQIAIATVSVATVEPPFGVMAPLWGIGLLTLWGARHGTFPPRRPR